MPACVLSERQKEVHVAWQQSGGFLTSYESCRHLTNVDWPGVGCRLVRQVCGPFRLREMSSLQKYGGATSAPSSQNAAEVSPGGAAAVGAAMTSTKPMWAWVQAPRVKKRVLSKPKAPAPGDCLTAS